MYYYFALCVLVACFVYVLRQKIEHLSIEEVDKKSTDVLERVALLEDEYKQLQVKLDKQNETMEYAKDKADEARDMFRPPID
jgi:bisphosphoglycerate-dependent phosphoglycerate mutase